MTMDAKVVAFYRSIFADLSVSRQESAELTAFLQGINPPPDKLLWLRGTAFRVGCEFITIDEDGDKDKLVALLRAINCIVHAIETTCMQIKHADEELGEEALPDAVPFDEEAVTEFYNGVFSDLSVDQEESQDLYDFFGTTHRPGEDDLVAMRATAFKVACDNHLADDKETNVKLFRCISLTVRAFELACLEPKPFQLVWTPVQGGGNGDDAAPAAAAAASFDLDVSLSDAVQKLWDLDDNRLDPNRDYRINVQEGKKPYWKEDKAEDPLFDYVDQSILKQRRTYKTFAALLDNYSAQTGVKEQVTAKEKREVNAFLKAVMETKPMQYCHLYCRKQNPDKVPADRGEFRQLLYKIWFELYRRDGGGYDSSGFEHVFVGEIKNGKISGFHNWVQFYLQEKAGELDYRGYIKPRSHNDARPDDNDQLLTLQFTWKGIEKTVGSSFIGVSPEFEFALYSMCFLVGDEENEIQLATGGVEGDHFELVIKCFKMAYDKVGTSFPEIKSHFEEG